MNQMKLNSKLISGVTNAVVKNKMADLPTEFDVVIIGTGIIESIVAAACSRIGKSVLHLDCHEYYGEDWASFNLENFKIWTKNEEISKDKNMSLEQNYDELLYDKESIICVHMQSNIYNVKMSENFQKERDNENKNNIVKNTKLEESINNELLIKNNLEKLSKKFNLDLCPKLIFAEGLMVQLLISSNIAKYTEFKSVSRILTWRNNKLENVPCSRADVFATKDVSVIEKRILVKTLTLFANYETNLHEFKGFEQKTFLNFLKFKNIPDNLIHYILYAIAMGNDTISCMDGVKACKLFLNSLGKYGNTPFIFPMYGSGELPQCFCRLSAVFGGVYCLQRGIEAIIVKNNECTGIISNGARLNCKAAVLSSSCILQNYTLDKNSKDLSRGVYITDRSILESEKEYLTFLHFPPIPNALNKSVSVIELNSGTCTSPEKFLIVHLTTELSKDAFSDLNYVVEALFETKNCGERKNSTKPNVLWWSTWNICKRKSLPKELKNVRICSTIDLDIDYAGSINEAKKIFSELYPNEEFLPRAPDPEEIILDSVEQFNENLKNNSVN